MAIVPVGVTLQWLLLTLTLTKMVSIVLPLFFLFTPYTVLSAKSDSDVMFYLLS